MSASAPVTVYVPRDSAARSVGADEVAYALECAAARQGRPIRLIRNGSRGMLWLEPLVEVVTAGVDPAEDPRKPRDQQVVLGNVPPDLLTGQRAGGEALEIIGAAERTLGEEGCRQPLVPLLGRHGRQV